ncbi:MAG: glutamine-hydrolyzing GMP synthase [Nanoarchaeota archaeon]|nr:glutamine-hydrolyzing GMP synthase [Nanoarchaeota archaeon]
MDRLIVVDLGGQYAHLIANRLRRLGFLADISQDILVDAGSADVKGIILSGGPSSVYEDGVPDIPEKIFELGKPILGLCYGHQLIAHKLGGKVNPGETKEYGLANIATKPSALFSGLDSDQVVWMSHGDTIGVLPLNFRIIASSEDCVTAAMENTDKKIYGLQFHPEVNHTENGMKILENFGNICNCKKEWDSENYFNQISEQIRIHAKDRKIFLLVSGGVDSVVLFTLLNKVLGKHRVFGMHVDNGLMRLDESRNVITELTNNGFDNLELIDARSLFHAALKGVVDPEEKREIIGSLFIDVISVKSDAILSSDEWLVAQGTIYPDTIETQGTENAALIKTHHNRVPKMQELIDQGKVIEPLSHLYKDEVRLLGKKIGMHPDIIGRHPFPGPGLGVRILCNDQSEPDLSSLNDSLRKIEASAFVIPIKSVGVQGDNRTYRHPALVPFSKDWDKLEKLSTKITNNIQEINRVVMIVKQMKCAFRLLKRTITEDRIQLLQQADSLVTQIITRAGYYDKIWQMPVVLAPLSIQGGETIILRPVDSQEAMTANFSKLPLALVNKLGEELLKIEGVDAVFYDITNKPPGTIEWE